jgi:hypothetical protein
MVKNKIGIGVLVLATLLVGMVLMPAASAQKEDNYSVTVEEAFKHANANVISFIAAKHQTLKTGQEHLLIPNQLSFMT